MALSIQDNVLHIILVTILQWRESLSEAARIATGVIVPTMSTLPEPECPKSMRTATEIVLLSSPRSQ
jgi:hypothetical protein